MQDREALWEEVPPGVQAGVLRDLDEDPQPPEYEGPEPWFGYRHPHDWRVVFYLGHEFQVRETPGDGVKVVVEWQSTIIRPDPEPAGGLKISRYRDDDAEPPF